MTSKISISLPDHLVEAARLAVAEGRAASVSAFIASAVQEHERERRLTDVLHEMDLELGRPGDKALTWADEALGIDDQ